MFKWVCSTHLPSGTPKKELVQLTSQTWLESPDDFQPILPGNRRNLKDTSAPSQNCRGVQPRPWECGWGHPQMTPAFGNGERTTDLGGFFGIPYGDLQVVSHRCGAIVSGVCCMHVTQKRRDSQRQMDNSCR